MPLYEFQCESCQKVTERIQKYSDPPMETCPACGGPVKKLFSSPAIQFKGSGFYINDYARKSSNGGRASGADSAEKSEKKESGGKSEKSEKSETSGKSESTTSTPAKSDS
jgi:putative FmdB family regulatory protein